MAARRFCAARQTALTFCYRNFSLSKRPIRFWADSCSFIQPIFIKIGHLCAFRAAEKALVKPERSVLTRLRRLSGFPYLLRFVSITRIHTNRQDIPQQRPLRGTTTPRPKGVCVPPRRAAQAKSAHKRRLQWHAGPLFLRIPARGPPCACSHARGFPAPKRGSPAASGKAISLMCKIPAPYSFAAAIPRKYGPHFPSS